VTGHFRGLNTIKSSVDHASMDSEWPMLAALERSMDSETGLIVPHRAALKAADYPCSHTGILSETQFYPPEPDLGILTVPAEEDHLRAVINERKGINIVQEKFTLFTEAIGFDG